MKLKFKNQSFQEAATAAVCDVFTGQPYRDPNVYTVDLGRECRIENEEWRMQGTLNLGYDELDVGYKNAEIELPVADLLKNLHEVQDRQNLEHSSLGGHAGRVTLPDFARFGRDARPCSSALAGFYLKSQRTVSCHLSEGGQLSGSACQGQFGRLRQVALLPVFWPLSLSAACPGRLERVVGQART